MNEADRLKRKAAFIEAVVKYLARDLSMRSNLGRYQMGLADGIEWARLCGLAGLSGCQTKAEAIATLTDLLD